LGSQPKREAQKALKKRWYPAQSADNLSKADNVNQGRRSEPDFASRTDPKKCAFLSPNEQPPMGGFVGDFGDFFWRVNPDRQPA
jgi:hypothetical protein